MTAKELIYRIGDLAKALQYSKDDEYKVLIEFEKHGLVQIDDLYATAIPDKEGIFTFKQSNKKELQTINRLKKFYSEVTFKILESNYGDDKFPLFDSPHVSTGIFTLNVSEEELADMNTKINAFLSNLGCLHLVVCSLHKNN